MRSLMSSRNSFAFARSRGIPEHGAGDAERILFFDAPHRHAQVCGLHDDRHAKRIDLFANRFSDLARQPLLNLKPAAEVSTSLAVLLRPMTLCLGMYAT